MNLVPVAPHGLIFGQNEEHRLQEAYFNPSQARFRSEKEPIEPSNRALCGRAYGPITLVAVWARQREAPLAALNGAEEALLLLLNLVFRILASSVFTACAAMY